MSFTTKISFVPKDNDEKSVSFDNVEIGINPHSIDMLEMKEVNLINFKSLVFRKIFSDGYLDYVSILTIEEFEIFYETYIVSKLNKFQKLYQFMKTELRKIRYNWVIVEVYEWESGMD